MATNPVAPYQPTQQHGRARCIEQRRANSKSAATDSALSCQHHGRRPCGCSNTVLTQFMNLSTTFSSQFTTYSSSQSSARFLGSTIVFFPFLFFIESNAQCYLDDQCERTFLYDFMMPIFKLFFIESNAQFYFDYIFMYNLIMSVKEPFLMSL